MLFKQKDPVFDSQSWTGSNLAAVQAFVDSHVGASSAREYRVLTEQDGEAGALRIDERGVIQLLVSTGHSILRGPLYGADGSAAGWQVLSPDELTAGYEPAQG